MLPHMPSPDSLVPLPELSSESQSRKKKQQIERLAGTECPESSMTFLKAGGFIQGVTLHQEKYTANDCAAFKLQKPSLMAVWGTILGAKWIVGLW